MKIHAAETTMTHLQDEYMKKYRMIIPSAYTNPEGISRLLEVAEADPKYHTISELIRIAEAKD